MREVQKTKNMTTAANRAFMAIGGTGAGKTTQFGTLPGKKFMYAFDPGCAASLVDADVDIVEFLPDLDDLDLAVQTLKAGSKDKTGRKKAPEPTTYVEWEKDFNERHESGFFNQYDWIGFDSVTTFSDMLMDRILHIDKKLGKHPEQAHWTAQMNIVKNVFRALIGTVGKVYAVVHEEMQKDDMTGRIMFQPVLTGKLRLRVPLMFGHILGFDGVENRKEGSTDYIMLTQKTREHPIVRTTMKGLDSSVDVTLDFNTQLEGQGLGGILQKQGLV